jgi:phage shock protein A
MALITRLSRLMRADLHAVLDRVEEPEVLLRQALREMQEELARDQQRQRLLGRERDQLDARAAELGQTLGRSDQELDVCFAAEKDDLARALVKRKLETQELQRRLESRRRELDAGLEQLEQRLDENRSRLEEMQQKAELLSEPDPEQASAAPWAQADTGVRAAEVEVAFLREKQRRARS